MKRFKGIVKNNIVVLEPGIHLRDGTEVEVRLRPSSAQRLGPFARLLNHPITRAIGMEEVLEEDQQEREERGSSRMGVERFGL